MSVKEQSLFLNCKCPQKSRKFSVMIYSILAEKSSFVWWLTSCQNRDQARQADRPSLLAGTGWKNRNSFWITDNKATS